MVDKCYALAVRYLQSGVEAQNTIHMSKITVGDPTNAQWLTIANAFKELWRGAQATTVTYVDWVATQVLGDGVSYSAINCRQVGGTVQTGLLTGTLTGSAVDQALAPLDTLVVSYRSALRGRSRRSHLSIGGFVEAQQQDGLWTTTHVTNNQTNINGFITTYGNGGTDPDFRWVVFSRGIASGCYPNPLTSKHELVHRATGDPSSATSPVVSALVALPVSTMRTRKR